MSNNLPPIRLHSVKRATKQSNRFCGPAVLSILTGLDTKDTARLLRHVSGKRMIKGIGAGHMKEALHRLGFNAWSWDYYGADDVRKRPTLARWYKVNTWDPSSTYLLDVGLHWAIIQGSRYICGLTKGAVPLRKSPKWRSRIKHIWRLERREEVDHASVIPPPPPSPSLNRDRKAVLALAAQWGIKVDDTDRDRENPDGNIWIWPPDALKIDPFEDDHYAYDWESAMEHVQTYVGGIKARNASSEPPFEGNTLLTTSIGSVTLGTSA